MASEGGLVALGGPKADESRSAEEISEGQARKAQEFRAGGSDLYVPLDDSKNHGSST